MICVSYLSCILLSYRDMVVKQLSVIFLFSIFHSHLVPVDSLISHQLNSTDWCIEFEKYIGDQVRIQSMPGIYHIATGKCIDYKCQ